MQLCSRCDRRATERKSTVHRRVSQMGCDGQEPAKRDDEVVVELRVGQRMEVSRPRAGQTSVIKQDVLSK